MDSKLVCEVSGCEQAVIATEAEIASIIAQSNQQATSSPDQHSRITSHAHRRTMARDKMQACVYCGQLKRHRIIDHLEALHAHEPEVAALDPRKNSEKRKVAIELLKNRGNFQHNVKVLRGEASHFIPVRRKVGAVPIDSYLPCNYCLGFFSKSELWWHVKYYCLQKHQMNDHDENDQKTSINYSLSKNLSCKRNNAGGSS